MLNKLSFMFNLLLNASFQEYAGSQYQEAVRIGIRTFFFPMV